MHKHYSIVFCSHCKVNYILTHAFNLETAYKYQIKQEHKFGWKVVQMNPKTQQGCNRSKYHFGYRCVTNIRRSYTGMIYYSKLSEENPTSWTYAHCSRATGHAGAWKRGMFERYGDKMSNAGGGQHKLWDLSAQRETLWTLSTQSGWGGGIDHSDSLCHL